jgi:peptidoglycan/xylan/chitin deacetylase (PgdA/CDA1 family)
MGYIKLIISLILLFLLIACWAGRNEKKSGQAGQDNIAHSAITSGKKIKVTANCFLYHRFNEGKYPSTNISASLFEEQLKYLINNKIPVITLGDLFRLAPGDNEPDRYVVLTIDDAFKSFYHYGFPLLKKYGLKATLFVNTETIGSGDYLDWDELKQLLEYGIEIGNHTHSHAYFLNEPSGQRAEIFRKDVVQAQNIFKNHLNYSCVVFAYPFGEYDSDMKNVINELGFLGAAAQNSGVVSEFSDPFALPRFPMTDQFGQIGRFIEKVDMNPLPVVEITPASTIPDINPPTLRIQFKDLDFDLEQIQCFIQGSDYRLTILDSQSVALEIKATETLTSRRHLYTITIPQKGNSKWYWFSHQWVFPGRP